MDRDEIERQEFPPARRGYDAAAVHEHLRRVADEFEALAARPRSASLAEGASTQVRAILEAAEAGAQQLRDDAGREASDHVERVGEAARGAARQARAVQAELDRLLGGLRSSAEALAGSLDELAATSARWVALSPAAQPACRRPRSAAPAPAGNGARSDDEAGARLVALNMALEGTPREEAAATWRSTSTLADVETLLDDVYTSAGR